MSGRSTREGSPIKLTRKILTLGDCISNCNRRHTWSIAKAGSVECRIDNDSKDKDTVLQRFRLNSVSSSFGGGPPPLAASANTASRTSLASLTSVGTDASTTSTPSRLLSPCRGYNDPRTLSGTHVNPLSPLPSSAQGSPCVRRLCFTPGSQGGNMACAQPSSMQPANGFGVAVPLWTPQLARQKSMPILCRWGQGEKHPNIFRVVPTPSSQIISTTNAAGVMGLVTSFGSASVQCPTPLCPMHRGSFPTYAGQSLRVQAASVHNWVGGSASAAVL